MIWARLAFFILFHYILVWVSLVRNAFIRAIYMVNYEQLIDFFVSCSLDNRPYLCMYVSTIHDSNMYLIES